MVIFYLHYKFILFYGFGILWIFCVIIAVKYNAEYPETESFNLRYITFEINLLMSSYEIKNAKKNPD